LPHGGSDAPHPEIAADFPRGRLLPMMKRLRNEVARAEKSGESWRSSVDALRPATQELWRSLGPEERRRFLRHPRAYWEVHRHRVAPEIDEKVKVELQSRGVVRHAARIVAIDAGRVSDRLFTLGPLRKGELWESTAVPELRVQAERLARRLLGGGSAR